MKHPRASSWFRESAIAARKLDPVTERRMREIQTRYQYVDAGIRDVNFKLDAEWQTYESRHKGKRA